MERLLQYLDDLDDLYGMIGLIGERLRRFGIAAASAVLMIAICASGIALAQLHPPLAMATLTILSVTLMYRSVTKPGPRWAKTA